MKSITKKRKFVIPVPQKGIIFSGPLKPLSPFHSYAKIYILKISGDFIHIWSFNP